MPVATITRDEFENTGKGFVGVVTLDDDRKRKAIAVRPGATVWLSEEEQVLTANAPRSEADNPLANGTLVLRSTGEEIRHRRPIRPPAVEEPAAAEPEEQETETGAAPAPQGEPEEGKRAPNEEVGTPEAVSKARTRPTATK